MAPRAFAPRCSAAHSREDLEFAVKAFAEVNEDVLAIRHPERSAAESKDPVLKP